MRMLLLAALAILMNGLLTHAAPPVVSTVIESTAVESAPVVGADVAQAGPIEDSFTYIKVPKNAKESTPTRELRIDWTRPRDWQASDSRGAVVFFHGGGWVGEQTDRYSPAHNISKDDPPAIVFLGENDALIPVATAERFQQLSKDAGLVSELVKYPGQSHGFFNTKVAKGKYYRDTLEKSIAFLNQQGWMATK